jgi:CRP/FNR family cyclic AMP-dependent transcriptional regulator
MVSIEVLRRVPCFQSLEADQLASISRSSELRQLPRDSFLFRAGDRADALYILVTGKLAVSLCDARGLRLQLATIEPGACLGEMGLSQRTPRSADVSATEDAVLVQIQRDQFERLMREEPIFALSLLADLSKKLQDANRKLENRVALSVKERLWLTLMTQAAAGRLEPAPKVTHLAVQIDASREMTSRALSELVRENKVRKESSAAWTIQLA